MGIQDLDQLERSAVQERLAIAKDVYAQQSSRTLTGGWQRIMSSDELPGVAGNGFFGALYRRHVNGRDEHVIAYRGMDGIQDLDDAAALALGHSPEQVDNAYKFAQAAIARYRLDPSEIEYAGHSMGGYLSKAVGLMMNSSRIYAFNSPGLFRGDLTGLPRRIMQEFGENKAAITERQIEDRVISVNSRLDPVSRLGVFDGQTIPLSTQGHPHSLTALTQSFNEAASGLDDPAPEEQHIALVPRNLAAAPAING